MAGIYLHIPFCSQACSYCDFHFSTNSARLDDMARALQDEVLLRRGYLPEGSRIETIYFGGGTPSLLPTAATAAILDCLRESYIVSPDAEVTLEANPDDVVPQRLREWRAMGVNRLSIGIQSFADADLKLLRRSHDGQQADRAVKSAQDLGFENITIDLIYGIPGSGRQVWEENVRQAIGLDVPHVSAYALTVEEKTLLHHQIAKGLISPEPDQEHAAQYFHLIDRLGEAGILQYELSNFAREGFHSRHNGAYWAGVPYLGIGPSAHSYDGAGRCWNVANNAIYLRKLAEGQTAIAETETLTDEDRYNEYIMTQLRTVRGVELAHVQARWGVDVLAQAGELLDYWKSEGWVKLDDGRLRLTPNGFMVSDSIIRELFWEE